MGKMLGQVVVTISSVLFSSLFKLVNGSTGDRSQMFYTCHQNCLAENCSGNFIISFHIPILCV